MENLSIEITNETKFNNVDVEVSAKITNLSYFIGNVSIDNQEFDGQHGYNDYEEEFGFIIKQFND